MARHKVLIDLLFSFTKVTFSTGR